MRKSSQKSSIEKGEGSESAALHRFSAPIRTLQNLAAPHPVVHVGDADADLAAQWRCGSTRRLRLVDTRAATMTAVPLCVACPPRPRRPEAVMTSSTAVTARTQPGPLMVSGPFSISSLATFPPHSCRYSPFGSHRWWCSSLTLRNTPSAAACAALELVASAMVTTVLLGFGAMAGATRAPTDQRPCQLLLLPHLSARSARQHTSVC